MPKFKAVKAAKKSAKAAPKKIARQKTFPQMADKKIQGIENAALRYVEVRDARMELSQQEIKEKGLLMDLLHKHKIKKYKRGNIDIELIVEKEKVKVKVKNTSDDDDVDAGNDADAQFNDSGELESEDADLEEEAMQEEDAEEDEVSE